MTIANAVMKQLKSIKAGIVEGIHASALLSMMFEGTWPIPIPEAEGSTWEAAADTNSNEEVAIQKPQTAFFSISDAIAAILK